MSIQDLHEYKEGYRDGLRVGANIGQVVADDNGSAEDVVKLITVLADSHILDSEVPHHGHTT